MEKKPTNLCFPTDDSLCHSVMYLEFDVPYTTISSVTAHAWMVFSVFSQVTWETEFRNWFLFFAYFALQNVIAVRRTQVLHGE